MQPWCVLMFNGYVDGCNCCENAKIDLFNSISNYAEICEGEGNIQVPCSCLNDENKVSAYIHVHKQVIVHVYTIIHACHACTIICSYISCTYYVIHAVAANIWSL